MTRVVEAYFRLLKLVLTGLLFLLVVPVTLQIVARYTTFIPRYIWTEEAARFLFIWIIMIGSSIAVRDRTHFHVNILPEPASSRWTAIGELVVDGAILVIAVVFLAYGWSYAAFGYSQTSELTGINMMAMHLAFPLAGATWILFVAERALGALAVLFRRSR